MRAWKSIVAIGAISLCVGTAAHADDTGIYAGASVGRAETDFSDNVLDDAFDGKDTAFKLFVGYRVLDWVGFEASYFDLGEVTFRGNQTRLGQFEIEEAGFGAFGMLYWNIAPTVDLFAKAGLVVSQAHVRTNTFLGGFDDTDNSTDLAWGVGGQVHFGKLAVRAEYERFDFDAGAGFDSPDMISVGASWTFF